MTEIKQVEVRSLGDLIDKVTPVNDDPHSGRLRDNSIYRGVANSSWQLFSSLERLGGLNPPRTKLHLEIDILRNFARYSRPYLLDTAKSFWELMVIGQHHGLPTRLLDWSYSPIIAAHFATLEASISDRVVWKFEWRKAHEKFKIKQRALLISELEYELQERKINHAAELMERGSLGDDDFVLLLDPPSLDSRVIAQSATFTFLSRKDITIDAFLKEKNLAETLIRYVIPHNCVDVIRDQLDICSVDERRLYPDLDGVAAEMRRFYSYSPAEGDET